MITRLLAGSLILLTALFNQPALASFSLAAFGDSITRGYPYYTNDANGIPNNGGYVPYLQSRLNTNNWGNGESAIVYNWGHPGETIKDGRARITEVLASNPDYALVMEGTNDLPFGWGPGFVYNKLAATLDQVAGDKKTPVIGTLLPRYDKNSYLNSDILLINHNLRELAAGNPTFLQDLLPGGLIYLYNLIVQDTLALADLERAHPSGTSWSTYMTDGLHPNLTGYSYLADEWYAALLTVKPNKSPVANAGPDQSVIGNQASGGYVTLNGGSSYDPDGSISSYAWSWSGGSVNGVTPTVLLPYGTTIVTLKVTDNDGASDTDTVSITVDRPVVAPMLYLLLLSD